MKVSKKIQLTGASLAKVKLHNQAMEAKRNKGVNAHIHDFKKKGRGVGKVAEEAATYLIGGYVDYSVWATGAKGVHFEVDILESVENPITFEPFKGKNIHVKSTSTKNMGGKESWTVNKNDNLLLNPSPKDIILLMAANESGEAYCYGWVAATLMKEKNLWKPCLTMQHKLAIYIKDIIPFIQEIR